jgi:hypothetical protein
MICLMSQLSEIPTPVPSYGLSAKLTIGKQLRELKGIIQTDNDAVDNPNATSAGQSTIYKWKRWIFAAKHPIEQSNSQHNTLLVISLK